MMMLLRIMLPQMIGYVKYFDKNNNRMSFAADDNELLKKYTKIWKKIRELIGKKFDSKPVWGDKYIGTRIKSYGDKVDTNFQGKKVPKESLSYKCLSLKARKDEELEYIILRNQHLGRPDIDGEKKIINEIEKLIREKGNELKNLFTRDDELIDLLLGLDEVIKDLKTALKH